jgi:nitronate monooxygenase
MGIGVFRSGAVRNASMNGIIGSNSGIGLEQLMTRELRLGDPTGNIRSALKEFPNQELTSRIIQRYLVEGKSTPFPTFEMVGDDSNLIKFKNRHLEELLVVSNFVEVNLSKRGHDNPVAINYLHKVQWPLLPSIFGAMLAGVDLLLIGAGLPKEIPAVLDDFSEGRGTIAPISVIGDKQFSISFDPLGIVEDYKKLDRPLFFGIISNHLGVKALPNVDGYIVEGWPAGGHSAPARSKGLNENGEPDYGSKDEMDFKILKGILERRFEKTGVNQPWLLAGGYAGRLKEARALGASGIQVGSPFGLARESSVLFDLKEQGKNLIMNAKEGEEPVYTDPLFSPSGFPFKLLQIDGTLSSKEINERENTACKYGYLVELYEHNGKVLTRCPAELKSSYMKKGGDPNETDGRGCICSGLSANVGFGNPGEPSVATAGSDLEDIRNIIKRVGSTDYTTKDVIDYIYRDE